MTPARLASANADLVVPQSRGAVTASESREKVKAFATSPSHRVRTSMHNAVTKYRVLCRGLAHLMCDMVVFGVQFGENRGGCITTAAPPPPPPIHGMALAAQLQRLQTKVWRGHHHQQYNECFMHGQQEEREGELEGRR